MSLKESLTHKIGPLPVWAYAAIGAGGFLILKLRAKSAASSSSTTPTGLAGSYILEPTPSTGFGGGSGGGTTGGGGTGSITCPTGFMPDPSGTFCIGIGPPPKPPGGGTTIPSGLLPWSQIQAQFPTFAQWALSNNVVSQNFGGNNLLNLSWWLSNWQKMGYTAPPSWTPGTTTTPPPTATAQQPATPPANTTTPANPSAMQAGMKVPRVAGLRNSTAILPRIGV